MFYKSIKKYP